MANGGRHGRVNACFPRACSERETSKDVLFASCELVSHPSERLRPLPQACALSLLYSRPVQAGAPHHKTSTLRRGEKETTPRLSQTGQTQVSRDTRTRGFRTHMSMVDFVSSSFHDLNPTGPPSHPRVRIRHRLVIAATWKDLPVSGLSSTGAQCTPSMEETVSVCHGPGFKTTQVECVFLQVATMTQWNPWQAYGRHHDMDCRS